MNLPNIIYIHSHDTGRYVEPYGHAIPTPNLQKLAEEGIEHLPVPEYAGYDAPWVEPTQERHEVHFRLGD